MTGRVRTVGVMLAIAGLAQLLSGCRDDTPLATTPAEVGNGRLIDVSMTEMDFDPVDLEVEVGELVTFRFVNKGTVRHEAVIGNEEVQRAHIALMDRPGFGRHRSVSSLNHTSHNAPNAISVEPGSTGQITFSFAQPDTILIACHEPGHYEAGMVATVVIS